MATSYPSGYDSLSNPAGDDPLSSPSHADQHANANDAVEAIEAELGLTPSGVYDTVSARLDAIAGAGTASISLASGTATAPSFYFTGDTNTGIWSPGADTLAVSTGGAERLRVGSTGNVGIGTSSPGALLHVYGASSQATLLSGDAASDLYIRRASTNASAPVIYFDKARGTNASPTTTTSGDGTGGIYFRAHDGSSFGLMGAITANVDGTVSTGVLPGRVAIYTTTAAGASTERMRIDSAGLITGTGTSLGAWTAYTPTLGGFTLGDATIAGAYMRIGKLCAYRALLTFGSTTSAASAFPTLTLPVTAAGTTNAAHRAQFFDTSTATYYTAASRQSSATVVTMGIVGSSGVHTTCTTTTPFTWATGDQIILAGTYEIA